MTKHNEQLDSAFIETQKRTLSQLKNQLTAVNRDRAEETASATQALNGQAREFEDDAQHLTAYELNGQLSESADRRLSAINRALEKIAEGTYGKSDLSGAPIGVERLKVLPEAIFTKQEQQAKDSTAST